MPVFLLAVVPIAVVCYLGCGSFFLRGLLLGITQIADLAGVGKGLDLGGEVEVFVWVIVVGTLLAILFKILRQSPGVFTCYTLCHVFHFIQLCFFSSFDHVIINVNEIQNLVVFANSWRLVRRKSDFSIDQEVIEVFSRLDVLYMKDI